MSANRTFRLDDDTNAHLARWAALLHVEEIAVIRLAVRALDRMAPDPVQLVAQLALLPRARPHRTFPLDDQTREIMARWALRLGTSQTSILKLAVRFLDRLTLSENDHDPQPRPAGQPAHARPAV